MQDALACEVLVNIRQSLTDSEMDEKLKVEWNDFHSNVSQSFKVLRHEEYLHDVTLVTDDKTQITAHKLILSACSDYFKSLFQTNAKHTHLLVCLNGVDGKVLGYVLDYMYYGQVQILKESLDGFMKVAQRFKLEGLKEEKESAQSVMGKADPEIMFHQKKKEKAPCKQLNEKNIEEGHKVEDISTNKQHDLDFKKYMKRTDDGKAECTFCGKKAYPPAQLKRHIESHITGMNIVCELCYTVFKTRESLRVHMYRHKL